MPNSSAPPEVPATALKESEVETQPAPFQRPFPQSGGPGGQSELPSKAPRENQEMLWTHPELQELSQKMGLWMQVYLFASSWHFLLAISFFYLLAASYTTGLIRVSR
jgi:hypothetical protein